MIMMITAKIVDAIDLMIPIALAVHLCLCASTCSNTRADGEIIMMHPRRISSVSTFNIYDDSCDPLPQML